MRPLSTHDILDVWEQGQGQPPWDRALIMLATAYPEMTRDELAALSIGQRDARLLTMREQTFGPRLTGLSECQACQGRLEFIVNVADIRVVSPTHPSPYQGEGTEGIAALSLSVGDYEVRFRLPNSLDQAAVTGNEDVAIARKLLLERCLLALQHNGEERAADQLPANVLDAVVEQMAQADPQADVQLALSCPACGHQWQTAFDIVSFFWSEINAWAARILREVHILASGYGWREADILALRPWRRQVYLEMVSG